MSCNCRSGTNLVGQKHKLLNHQGRSGMIVCSARGVASAMTLLAQQNKWDRTPPNVSQVERKACQKWASCIAAAAPIHGDIVYACQVRHTASSHLEQAGSFTFWAMSCSCVALLGCSHVIKASGGDDCSTEVSRHRSLKLHHPSCCSYSSSKTQLCLPSIVNGLPGT